MANSPHPEKSFDDTSPESTEPGKAASPEVGIAGPAIQIGHYRIVKPIGRGGMGIVYKAVHASLQKTVALKLLLGVFDSDQDTARFTHESVALGKMNHPNVVTAFDAGICANGPYLVTEFVDGISLMEIVKHGGPLSLAAAAQVGVEVAQGLQHIHGHGLVHRDVKPSNLMLTSSGRVKILDLGIALLQFNDEPLTGSGQILGTHDYMAPEQWLDSHKVDYRVDIYGLACTLYFLLAGRAPYAAPEYLGVDRMTSHLRTPFPSLRAVRPDVPLDFDRLIQAMASKKPERRQTDLQQIEALLKTWAEHADLAAEYHRERPEVADSASVGVMPLAQLSDTQPPHSTARHLRPVAVLTGIVLVALFIGFAIYFQAPPRQAQVVARPTTGPVDEQPEKSPAPISLQSLDSRVLYRHEGRVNNIDLLADRSTVVSVGEDRSTRFYDLDHQQALPWKVEHREPVTDVSFVPEKNVVTICTDGKLRLWSQNDGQLSELFSLPMTTAGGLTSLAVSRDRRWAATGSWDQHVRLWDLNERRAVAVLDAGEVVYDVAVAADGKQVFYCGRNHTVHVWKVGNNAPEPRFIGHTDWVMAIDVSPDEKYCLTASFDDTVRLWKVDSGQEVLQYPAVKPKTARFFAQGRLFVFGDRSGKIHVCDALLHKKLLTLQDEGPIDALAVSPQGDVLLSGTDLGSVTYWRLQ